MIIGLWNWFDFKLDISEVNVFYKIYFYREYFC